jgi:ABC-type nitrate/sulfonate/bicarbonate transport system permease component
MKKIFFPQFIEKIPKAWSVYLALIQAVIFLSIAQFGTSEVMPKPDGVLVAAWKIIFSKNFMDDFIASLSLIFWGMFLSISISLFIVYISRVPFLESIPKFVSKLRFLTFTGMVFVFTMLVKNVHDIKISLLLFGIIPFFVTSLLSYIDDISPKEYELCYSLKLNRWHTLYEVVIKGKLHLVLEVIRQNFAIAWMMITSVEAISMSEGGLGTLMIKSNKYVKIDEVFGVLLVIFLIGIFFDYFFDLMKVWLFPYTNTKRYKKLWINKAFASLRTTSNNKTV